MYRWELGKVSCKDDSKQHTKIKKLHNSLHNLEVLNNLLMCAPASNDGKRIREKNIDKFCLREKVCKNVLQLASPAVLPDSEKAKVAFREVGEPVKNNRSTFILRFLS